MSQEIEIERKNQLTEAEFELLKKGFHVTDKEFISQTNHYFETADFSLRKNMVALRIREKMGRFTLTLKQPHKDGLLETHQTLNEKETNQMLDYGSLPKGEVYKQLQDLQIDTSALCYLGALQTSRAEKPYNGATIVLDKSYYLGAIDYELELEAASPQEADSLFASLLHTYNIEARPTKNKIVRFFERKTAIDSGKDS